MLSLKRQPSLFNQSTIIIIYFEEERDRKLWKLSDCSHLHYMYTTVILRCVVQANIQAVHPPLPLYIVSITERVFLEVFCIPPYYCHKIAIATFIKSNTLGEICRSIFRCFHYK